MPVFDSVLGRTYSQRRNFCGATADALRRNAWRKSTRDGSAQWPEGRLEND